MKSSRTVYSVRKCMATKTISVGDFESVGHALNAMIVHYITSPKRGNIEYRITRENIEESEAGLRTRSISYNIHTLQDPDAFRSYSRAQLDEMIQVIDNPA